MKPDDIDDARPRSNTFFRFLGRWLQMIFVFYVATFLTSSQDAFSLVGNAIMIGLAFALPGKLIGDTMRNHGHTTLFNGHTAFMLLYVGFFVILQLMPSAVASSESVDQSWLQIPQTLLQAAIYLAIIFVIFPIIVHRMQMIAPK